MSDNNYQQLILSYDLEEQFCEDLSAEEMKAVQGGLTTAGDDIYSQPIHPSPIEPAPKPIDEKIVDDLIAHIRRYPLRHSLVPFSRPILTTPIDRNQPLTH